MGSVSRVCLPSLTSLGGLILTLIALSGEVPTALAGRLSKHGSYTQKVLKSLRAKELIYTYRHDGVNGFRLRTKAKDLMLEQWPQQFEPFFCGGSTTNAPGYKIADRVRLHRMADTMVMMINSGVLTLPWEKPDVFCPTPPAVPPHIDQPAYFNSREIKRLGKEGSIISSSRAVGVLLADGNIFAVYNTGAGQMKWSNKAEIRLIGLLQTELCLKRLSGQFGEVGQDAILFGAEMPLLPGLLGMDGSRPFQGFFQDRYFSHFHFLTSDHRGEVILQLLCELKEKVYLDGLLAYGLSPPRPNWIIENDAMDGDSPVLFGYTCDVPRIRRFAAALALHGQEGTLFCFDFQVETLRKICGSHVSIRPIDFDAYEGGVFHQPKELD